MARAFVSRRHHFPQVVWGKQYANHNPNPGPVYDGRGYSTMSQAIHTGDADVVKGLLKRDASLAHELSTGKTECVAALLFGSLSSGTRTF